LLRRRLIGSHDWGRPLSPTSIDSTTSIAAILRAATGRATHIPPVLRRRPDSGDSGACGQSSCRHAGPGEAVLACPHRLVCLPSAVPPPVFPSERACACARVSRMPTGESSVLHPQARPVRRLVLMPPIGILCRGCQALRPPLSAVCGSASSNLQFDHQCTSVLITLPRARAACDRSRQSNTHSIDCSIAL
jgi:hypothetical protein